MLMIWAKENLAELETAGHQLLGRRLS